MAKTFAVLILVLLELSLWDVNDWIQQYADVVVLILVLLELSLWEETPGITHL